MSDLHAKRMNILNLVASGDLTLEQGNRLLVQLENQAAEEAVQAAATAWPTTLAPASEDPDPPAAPAQEMAAQAPVDPAVSSVAATTLAPEPPTVASDPSSEADPPLAAAAVQPDAVTAEAKRSGGSRGLWAVPFVLGLLLTLVSVNWMYLGYAAAGLGWGFWLSFIPLALGILMMWAGWEMRRARWLHLRVRQPAGERHGSFSISLPLPIGLTRWAVQRFGKYSPDMNGQSVGDIWDGLEEALAADGPMHIYVDDEHGEQVEVWIDGPNSNQ